MLSVIIVQLMKDLVSETFCLVIFVDELCSIKLHYLNIYINAQQKAVLYADSISFELLLLSQWLSVDEYYPPVPNLSIL